MPTPVFRAEAVDGALEFREPERIAAYLRTLDGKPLDVAVGVHRDIRSLRANRYYWGCVLTELKKGISEWTGSEVDEVHEILSMKFLRLEDDPVTGMPRRQSTARMNDKDFAEYIDRCIRFAAELGVYVPSPGEVVA